MERDNKKPDVKDQVNLAHGKLDFKNPKEFQQFAAEFYTRPVGKPIHKTFAEILEGGETTQTTPFSSTPSESETRAYLKNLDTRKGKKKRK